MRSFVERPAKRRTKRWRTSPPAVTRSSTWQPKTPRSSLGPRDDDLRIDAGDRPPRSSCLNDRTASSPFGLRTATRGDSWSRKRGSLRRTSGSSAPGSRWRCSSRRPSRWRRPSSRQILCGTSRSLDRSEGDRMGAAHDARMRARRSRSSWAARRSSQSELRSVSRKP
jgi:hypothetical protein